MSRRQPEAPVARYTCYKHHYLRSITLKPAAEVKKVRERKFPSGEASRGERSAFREGGLDQVLIPLVLQDPDGLCLRVDDPHFPDACFGIERQLRGSVVGCGGRGKNLHLP